MITEALSYSRPPRSALLERTHDDHDNGACDNNSYRYYGSKKSIATINITANIIDNTTPIIIIIIITVTVITTIYLYYY